MWEKIKKWFSKEEEEDDFLDEPWDTPLHEVPFGCGDTQPIRNKGLLDTLPE